VLTMDRTIVDRLTPVLQEVFDNDEIVAAPELTARDVDGWDSLGNVRLLLEVEKVFSVRFSAAEIGSLNNLGDLAQLIGRKMGI
jgi:acyl carrier protein